MNNQYRYIYIPQADLTGFCNVWVPYSSQALDFRRLWRAEHGLSYYSPPWGACLSLCLVYKNKSLKYGKRNISWFCSKLGLWVHVWISAQPFQGYSRCSQVKDGLCYMCAFVRVRSGRYFIEFRHCRTSVTPANIYLTASRTNRLIKSSLQCEWVSVALPHYFMICHRHLPPYYRLQELQSQTETFHQGNSLHLMRCFVEM